MVRRDRPIELCYAVSSKVSIPNGKESFVFGLTIPVIPEDGVGLQPISFRRHLTTELLSKAGCLTGQISF